MAPSRALFAGLFLLIGLASSPWVNAEGQSLSPAEYGQLQAIFELMETEQLEPAKLALKQLKEQTKSDYTKALVDYNLGKIYLDQEAYKSAIAALKRAYDSTQLPEDQNLSLLHIIGQLHCQLDQWKSCAGVLQQWVKQAPGQARPEDYILIGQAYAQLERWSSVVSPVSKALADWKPLSPAKPGQLQGPPRNWYQIAVLAHVELKQWKRAVKRQQQMLKYYPSEPADWRQLASLHMQYDNLEEALAVQRLGYNRGLLNTERDYKLLAQLLLNKSIPHRAGEVLAEGIAKGDIKPTEELLKLLSQSWLLAKEWTKAEAALADLQKLKPTLDGAKQLAQVQMELKHWKSAAQTLKQAIRLSKKKDENLQLLLGIAQVNLHNYAEARAAFNRAVSSEKEQDPAKNWLNYLDRLES